MSWLNPFKKCTADPIVTDQLLRKRSEQVFIERCTSFRICAPKKKLEMMITIHEDTKRIEVYFFDSNNDGKMQITEDHTNSVSGWVCNQVLLSCARFDLNVSRQQEVWKNHQSLLTYMAIFHVTLSKSLASGTTFMDIIEKNIVPQLGDAFNIQFVMETPFDTQKTIASEIQEHN